MAVNLEVFKCAAIDDETFSNVEIKQLFLELQLTCEEDISIAIDILRTYRPLVLDDISQRLFGFQFTDDDKCWVAENGISLQ